jgi:hypothetical protein
VNQLVPTFHGFFQLETEGFWRADSGAKACARPAGPKSRALETDASRLRRRLHGARRSSAVCLRCRGGTCQTQRPASPRRRQMCGILEVFAVVAFLYSADVRTESAPSRLRKGFKTSEFEMPYSDLRSSPGKVKTGVCHLPQVLPRY